MDREAHFTNIFETNVWNGQESRSGAGSDHAATTTLRPLLVDAINRLGVKTMVDAPCGDYHWMKLVIGRLAIDAYLGVDIVPAVIAGNTAAYAEPPRVQFMKMDLVEEILPKSDLIFSRDCLVHFSYATARQIVRQFIASESTWLAMTTFTSTTRAYHDIDDGAWRSINFELPPMNLPAPAVVIVEECVEDYPNYTDKSIGFWRIADLEGWL